LSGREVPKVRLMTGAKS